MSRIATTATDVTESRWSAEMAERVSAIVESSDEAIFGMSPDLLVTSWNAGAELLYGYAAAEAIDRHVTVPLECQTGAVPSAGFAGALEGPPGPGGRRQRHHRLILDQQLRAWGRVDGPAEDSLDPDRIVFLRGLGPSDGWGLLPDLVGAFVADAPTLVASIAAALTTADAQAVEHCAHRLRGAAANLGAVAVTDVCAELEAMGHSGELTGGQVALSRLEAEVDRGASALRTTLAGA